MTIRKPIFASRAAAACSYAVALGANNARRLSREWRVSRTQASRSLSYACALGTIRRVGFGQYASAVLGERC